MPKQTVSNLVTSVPPGDRTPLLRVQGVPESMEPEHQAAVCEGRAQIRRGEVASDEEIEALYRRAGL